MADLMDRKAILKHIEKVRHGAQMMDDIRRASIIMNGMDLCEEAVMNQPTVDAVPVRRGKWKAVTEDGDVYKRICSCCGREAFFQNDDPDELYDGGRYELSDFCPHCGADMRGERHDVI